jgi:DNA-dependent metalloprotease WSS1
LLENGAFAQESLDPGEVLPEHLCGGTFRSRGGQKRKVKPKITYKERQERRIKKKFGMNGLTLGADEEIKSRLENGKRPAGKPRVAGSARGRELRAAAALARFEVKEEPQIKDGDLITDSEAESDYDVVVKVEPDDALDINGKRLLDMEGHGMVKVCEDEDEDSDEVKKERLDLQGIPSHSQRPLPKSAPRPSNASQTLKPPLLSKTLHPLDTAKKSETSTRQQSMVSKISKHSKEEILSAGEISTAGEDGGDIAHGVEKPRRHDSSCSVCSVANDKTALTCVICSNVLKPEFVPNSWRCQSLTCAGSCYVNAGDVGLCGVCGNRKCS